jgi:hypothetical protein
MAKKASDKLSTPAEEALKRQKKQARLEAKLMLEIEEAKKKLKNAQKKQSKAQALVEARSAYIQSLEARLTELRTPIPEPENEIQPQSAVIEHQQKQSEEELKPPFVEESSLSQNMVVNNEVIEREGVQENGNATEMETAPTTPRKAPARKTSTTRKPTATRRPVNNTPSSKQSSSDSE